MKRSVWRNAVVLGFVVVACGGSGDGEGSADQAAGEGDAGQANSNGASLAAPAIDAASMPPAGEALVEVDGQTFVFRQADMLEGPFACDIGPDVVTINFQSDGHDLLLQGRVQDDGTLRANVTVAPEGLGHSYGSSNARDVDQPAAIDGAHVLYVGSFDSVSPDTGFAEVGSGTVAVTCP